MEIEFDKGQPTTRESFTKTEGRRYKIVVCNDNEPLLISPNAAPFLKNNTDIDNMNDTEAH